MRKGWRLSLLGGVTALALLASGTAWLHMRDATGALATATLGLNAGPIALDTRAGRVFVTSYGIETCTGSRACAIKGSMVSVVDARSGTLLRSVPFDQAQPDAVAADERSGRAFV